MAAYDEDSVLRRGRGRPRKENAYEHVIKTRLNCRQVDMLHDCTMVAGLTQSEIMREALELYYETQVEGRKNV